MASRSQAPFSPLTYAGAAAFLGKRDSRKLRNNTYLIRRAPDQIAVQLHSTDVVTYYADGRTFIYSGGWMSNTTKDRINGFAPVSVSQADFTWYVDGKPWDGSRLQVA